MDAAEAASALAWWADAGVDSLVAEEPRDWLKPAPTPTRTAAAPVQPAEALPEQLALFHGWLKESDKLPYAAPGAPRLLPAGDPAAPLMILTDMPSEGDCSAGALLSGDAGRLFDRMLAAIGLSRDGVYLAALSCLRAPGGRFDAAASADCARIARHHAGLVKPRAMLLIGDACAKALLGDAVARARGRWHEIETPAGPVRALATLRPEALLRQPALKALAWEDLQLLMEGLKP